MQQINNLVNNPITFLEREQNIIDFVSYEFLGRLLKSNNIAKNIINRIPNSAYDGMIFTSPYTLDLKAFTKNFNRKALPHILLALKKARLFGGAYLIILTDGDDSTPLTDDVIKNSSSIEFRSVVAYTNQFHNYDYIDIKGTMYHKSRVIFIDNGASSPTIDDNYNIKENSSLNGVILTLASLHQVEKVVIELLHKSKIDIFKLAQKAGDETEQKGFFAIKENERRDLINALDKVASDMSYKDLISIGSNDDFMRVQSNFGGIPEILEHFYKRLQDVTGIPRAYLTGAVDSGLSNRTIDMETFNNLVYSYRSETIGIVEKCVDIFFLNANKTSGVEVDFEPLEKANELELAQIRASDVNAINSSVASGTMSTDMAMQMIASIYKSLKNEK